MEAFPDRLIASIDRKGCPIVVGIDPRLDLMPTALVQGYFARYGETHQAASLAIRDFNLRLLEAIAPHVPAVKVQVAFYEAFGPLGMQVIADVKRGDIEMTAQAYATAYLASSLPGIKLSPGFDADAITVNPYVGGDGVVPFVQAATLHGKGLFILVKTSNPGSGDIQNLVVEGVPLYEQMAPLLQRWGQGTEGRGGYQAVGAVVGATYPAEAARLRSMLPHTYFLVPGYGAQGGRATDVQACFNPDGYGAVVSSSRHIMYAYQQDVHRSFGAERFPEAAAAAVLAMKQELAAVLRRPT
jgi:orotidine-5'-phosphate decarboxylase